MSDNKIKSIIISGALAQDHEFIYPYYRLLEESADVDVCLLGGKPVDGILGTRLPPNKDQVVKDIDQINISDYNLLILPGGVKAMEKIRLNKNLINFIKKFHDSGNTIGCICSGVQLMISAKIVKNKKIAGYYSLEDDIINAGAEYTDLPAVVDGNIVTTAHYKDMGPWMRAVLNTFKKNI
jgi:protease I